jgi:hypothetical protein
MSIENLAEMLYKSTPKRQKINLEFFDKDGNPISTAEWVSLFKFKDYFRLTTQLNGITIHTSWTGVDQPNPKGLWQTSASHSKWDPNDTPLIIRTAVWDQDLELIEATQYPNAAMAKAGHEETVARYESL